MGIQRTEFSSYELTGEDAIAFREHIKNIRYNEKAKPVDVNRDANFVLEPLTQKHDVSQFSFDESMISTENFLKKSSLNFQQENLAKTFVLTHREDSSARVWGYITLVMSEIFLNENELCTEMLGVPRYESYPATKIVKLAVDKEIQHKGLECMLLDWAIDHVQLNIMPHVGCRYMVLDAQRELIEFYEKNGFQLFSSDTNERDEYPMMFMDLYKMDVKV